MGKDILQPSSESAFREDTVPLPELPPQYPSSVADAAIAGPSTRSPSTKHIRDDTPDPAHAQYNIV
jgi:hypothetical protein